MAPQKRRGASPKTPSAAQYRRLAAITQQLVAMVGQLSDDVAQARDERQIQLKRIAQLQAELDAVKKTWEKMQSV